jgi:tRNA(fMet)-specific endonuclease VapC
VRRFLLDTGIAGSYVSRDPTVLPRFKQEIAQGNHIGIGIPVLAELYYGIEFSASREKNLQRLRAVLPSLRVWPFNEEAAVQYGRLAAQLRRQGRPMQVPDLQIAAIALSLGRCTIVTKDSDFGALSELTVENWAAEKGA